MPRYRVSILVESPTLASAISETMYGYDGDPRKDIMEISAEEESK